MTTTEPGTTLDGTPGTGVPRRMRQLSWRTWRGVLVRSVQNFVNDNCSDWAAALTYYGVLALFPSAIVVVALVGLVSDGERTLDTVVDLANQVGAGAVLSDDEGGVLKVIRSVVLEQSNPKLLLSFGLLGALWSASGFIGAFTRASNAVYGVTEGRPVWRLRPLQIGLAAITLVRFGRFPGGTLFSGMVYAPLVMPEVITGLAMLLLFVAIGFARGFWTLTLAHITFSMCFVAVVVQSRLITFDRSLEEAALDLGCPPFRTFFTITLPLILPAVVAGWMLAFTLSLDDLVISSFTTGPGATTLPMKIYSQVRLGVTPEINAICTILIAIVATGVIIASIVTKRREVERQRAERLAIQDV